MSDHMEGRPVSATTYKSYACRCDGCRSAATEYQRKMRNARGGALRKVENKTRNLASDWVRAAHPEQWDIFRDKAYAHYGIRRRRAGEHGD